MSMAGPGGNGGGEEGGGLFTEINVTPLTDIFLVLLIIFMVTATGLSTASMDVSLPKATAPGASVEAANVVTVSVDAKNRLYVGKDETSRAGLEAAVRAALRTAREPSVVLAGDRAVALENVVAVMEAARKAGAKRFAIAVAAPQGPGQAAGPAAAAAAAATVAASSNARAGGPH